MVRKQVNFRLSLVHVALLERVAKQLDTNKTDVVERAIYNYATEWLSESEINEVIDKFYKGIPNDFDVSEIWKNNKKV